MKIITVNIPVQYIATIKTLTGDTALYPSRSELIRVAIRDFLIKELKTCKNIPKGNIFQPGDQSCEEIEDTNFVNVPTDIRIGNTIIRDFKRYKIIDRNEKLNGGK